MKQLRYSVIIIFLIKTVFCEQDAIKKWFEKINADFVEYNRFAAIIAWESSIHPSNLELQEKSTIYQKNRILWQHQTCDAMTSLQEGHMLNKTQRRQMRLLCMGPIYTLQEAKVVSALSNELQTIYSDAEICIPSSKNIQKEDINESEAAILNYVSNVKHYLNFETNGYGNDSVVLAAKVAVYEDLKNIKGLCLKGETDFNKLMRTSRNEAVLRWLWLVWREKVVLPMKKPLKKLVGIENFASRRNGYKDIGAAWRDELEIPNLREFARHLYEGVRPLYNLLHGVVRFYLRKQYGGMVPETGPIPAHLLGDLWAQNWEPLADLIVPSDIKLDKSIEKMNWTVINMVKRAEDFYQAMGLPQMTNSFWRQSVFSRENDETRCHGTAADMFKPGDFRLLYCSGNTADDFYVIHHEMGHIQYYMAYENQPGIFRSANSAFHESIGDAIMYGVITPQHLYRLGLINDTLLYPEPEKGNPRSGSNKDKELNSNEDNNKGNEINIKFTTDDVFMLKEALNKIPQIPFSLLIDEYRWKLFEGGIDDAEINKEFWDMTLELQGIKPYWSRAEEYFDVGAKFHVPDNTPYIRYFLSSFLQHQLFEAFCKTAVFGRRNMNEELPSSIALNRCDIYGSKAVGKLLKDIMSRGNSQHWRDILLETTGQGNMSSSSLQRYYRPLVKVLKKLVRAYDIPIGW